MDIVTSHLVAFQVSLFILQVPFDNINGQTLYETPQGDQFKALEANTYNRKTYGKYGLLVIIYFLSVYCRHYHILCVQLHQLYVF